MINKITVALVVFFVVALDQLSKWAVLEHVIKPELSSDSQSLGFFEWLISAGHRLGFARIENLPFLNTVMVWNTGVSFGMFRNEEIYGAYVMAAIALIIGIMFLLWAFKTGNRVYVLLAAMACGGAIGNVIDRFRFGAVADFIDVHAFGYHWPAFNVADSFITVSVLIMVVYGIFLDKSAKDGEKESKEIQTER